jgi:hypothetical protein
MAFFKRKQPAPKPETGAKSAIAPVVTLIAADLALRLGDRLLRRGVERGLLKGQKAPSGRVIHGPDFRATVIGTVAAAVARRSVPGAILVGGGLIAKALRDRRRERLAAAKAASAEQDPDKTA